MQPYQADSAALPATTRFHLALADFADEVVATLARLVAYVGALALLAILALAGLGRLPDLRDDEAALKPGWSLATSAVPEFALSHQSSTDRSVSYSILRHPEGGRKDVLRWAGDADRPVAELEIYRPGGEFEPATRPASEIAARMGLSADSMLEEAGLVDSKLGPVTLFGPSGAIHPATSCLGYHKRIEDPPLQISGWSCQGASAPLQRAAIACTLNRLVLLTSGQEPKLAALFAPAELNRRSCGASTSADWLLGADNAQLRGAL